MTLFRSLFLVCPMACLLAQTAPPNATPVPKSMNPEFVSGVPAPSIPPDRVIITVGDDIITAAQFEDMISALPSQYQETARGAGRKQFADNVVKILTLSQEGKRRKIDQDTTYKRRVAFDAANILANMTAQQITETLKPTEAEMRKFYEEHKAEFERVRAKHILIRAQGAPTGVQPGKKDLTDQEALAKAQEVRKKLLAGADFATLARQESDDSGAPSNGGDLGAFGRGQMVPQFEAAAFGLKPGEISEPVKSQFGYHVIKVDAHEFKSLDEARADVEKRLTPEVTQKFMADLEKKSTIKLDPDYFNLPKK
jgi:peptidyl-prolyl cis-trans isomerase C